MTILDLTVLVSTPSGLLNLNTPPYRVAGDSFTDEQVSHRKTEASNPYVEGTFVVNTVRENVGTSLNVWVVTETRMELLRAVQQLTDAFDQAMFTVTLDVGGATQLWNCVTSDYSVESGREFMHATRAKVVCQLNRLPYEEVI